MSGIIFKVDRKAIKEGEAVIIHWECQNPDSVSLKVDDGYQSAILQLADSGNREISITRSKGKTILTLRVVENGKLKKKEISIKVKKEKPQKARPADNTGRRRNGSCGKSCPLNNFFAKAKSDFGNFFCRMKSVWNYLPDKKKLAYIVLGLIIVVMILASISPKLLIFGLMAIALYLFWIIFKK